MSQLVQFSFSLTEAQHKKFFSHIEANNIICEVVNNEYDYVVIQAYGSFGEVIEEVLPALDYTTCYDGCERDLYLTTYFNADGSFSHQSLEVDDHANGVGYHDEEVSEFNEWYDGRNKE